MRATPGRVGFTATPTLIENSKPADLSNEDFLFFSSVLSKPLSWSQVLLVIISYDNTIGKICITTSSFLDLFVCCGSAYHRNSLRSV